MAVPNDVARDTSMSLPAPGISKVLTMQFPFLNSNRNQVNVSNSDGVVCHTDDADTTKHVAPVSANHANAITNAVGIDKHGNPLTNEHGFTVSSASTQDRPNSLTTNQHQPGATNTNTNSFYSFSQATDEELIHMGAVESLSDVEKYDFGTNENGFRRTFPEKLMEILSMKESTDAMQWVADGDAFVILSVANCVHTILPRFFKQTKFASFIRKVNRWGFKQISKGTRNIVYRHPSFKRGQRELCMTMRCSTEGTDSTERKRKSQGNAHLHPHPTQQRMKVGMPVATNIPKNPSSSSSIVGSQLHHHQYGMMPPGNQPFNQSAAVAVQAIPQGQQHGQQPDGMQMDGMIMAPTAGTNMTFAQMPQQQTGQPGIIVPQMMTSNSNVIQQAQQQPMGQGYFPQQQMGMPFLAQVQGQTTPQVFYPRQQIPTQQFVPNNDTFTNNGMMMGHQPQPQQFLQMPQNFVSQQHGNFPIQQQMVMTQGNAANSVISSGLVPPHMAMLGQQVQSRTENPTSTNGSNPSRNGNINTSTEVSSVNSNGPSVAIGQQAEGKTVIELDSNKIQSNTTMISNHQNTAQSQFQQLQAPQLASYPQMQQLQASPGQWWQQPHQQQRHPRRLQQPQYPQQQLQQQFVTSPQTGNAPGPISMVYPQQQLSQQQLASPQSHQHYWNAPI